MKRENSLYIKGVFVIIAVFFLAKLFFLSRYHSVIWDEAIYIGIGKYLWSAGQAGLFDIQRPLLLPLIIGLFWRLGLNPIIAGEILGIIFSSGLIFAGYLVGRRLVNEKVGLIASMITATLPAIVLYSSYILTDIPSVLFSLLAIYSLISRKWSQAGVFFGLSFLLRFPHLLTAIAATAILLFACVMKRDKIVLKNVLTMIVFFGLTIAPWLVFNAFYFGGISSAIAPLQKANVNINDVAVHNAQEPSFYAASTLKQSVLFVFLLPFIFFYIKNRWYKELKFNVLLLAALSHLIYLSFFIFNDERYAISFIPFLTVLASVGIYKITDVKDKIFKKIITIIIIALVVALTARTAYHDQDYYYWRDANEPPMYSEYYKFFTNNPREGTIFTSDPVHATYADNKFIANSFFIEQTAEEYDKNKDSIAAVIYLPASFPCLSDDIKCEDGKKLFLKKLIAENELVFNKTYDGKTYYIFERNPKS
ncbi:TPA: hypothetical protein HA219_01550 [Candidatus Woesearchaeota archaeon]|nr:glycosyltransferase family 39 protein [Candidatus Woesearchaeota archaeon]HIH39391.1 hypothetical protein [Candidatus Woesearchaeota archaeon]